MSSRTQAVTLDATQLLRNSERLFGYRDIPDLIPVLVDGFAVAVLIGIPNNSYGVIVKTQAEYSELVEKSRVPGSNYQIDGVYSLAHEKIPKCRRK